MKLQSILAFGLIIQLFIPAIISTTTTVDEYIDRYYHKDNYKNHSNSSSRNEDAIVQTIVNQLIERVGPYKPELLSWARSVLGEQQTRADFLTCDVCIPALEIVRPWLNYVHQDLIIGAVTIFCQLADLAPEPDLCLPTITNFAKPVIFIARTKDVTELSNDDFCGIINNNCRPVSSEFTDWPTIIDSNKPEVVVPPLVPSTVETVKILQFTDVHVDLNYLEGSAAQCGGYPICCRADTPQEPNTTQKAGPYGDYNCALPVKALDATFDHAKTNHPDTKYIFLTGDYIHSGVWLYNEEENSRHIEEVTTKLKSAFPNVKIFPLTGNHEAAPCNMYPPPSVWDYNNYTDFDISWMYRATIAPFRDIFENEPEQLANFMYGGYYTVKPNPTENLRLVVLNTNLCYINNFWLAFDPIDPAGQLQWFAQTMLDIETNSDDSVLILAHISPGSGSCWTVWSDKYDKIINRFENIIKGQFFGHSHNDYFSLAFERDADPPRPTSTLYISPSMLTDGMNTGYKAFYFDGARGDESTWEVVNHETYLLNTVESNMANEPRFEKLYSAKEIYGLESFRPSAYYDLVLRMIEDKELFQKYERHYYKNTTSSRYNPCSNQGTNEPNCIVNHLCNTVRAYSGDNSHCERLRRLMDEYLQRENNNNSAISGQIANYYFVVLSAIIITLSLRVFEF